MLRCSSAEKLGGGGGGAGATAGPLLLLLRWARLRHAQLKFHRYPLNAAAPHSAVQWKNSRWSSETAEILQMGLRTTRTTRTTLRPANRPSHGSRPAAGGWGWKRRSGLWLDVWSTARGLEAPVAPQSCTGGRPPRLGGCWASRGPAHPSLELCCGGLNCTYHHSTDTSVNPANTVKSVSLEQLICKQTLLRHSSRKIKFNAAFFLARYLSVLVHGAMEVL